MPAISMLSLTAKVIPAQGVGELVSISCARAIALSRGTREIQTGLRGAGSKRSYTALTFSEIFMLLPPGEAPVIPVPRRPAILAHSAAFPRYLRSEPQRRSPFSSLRALAVSVLLPPFVPLPRQLSRRLRQLENARACSLQGYPNRCAMRRTHPAARHTRLDQRNSIARAPPPKLA